MLVKAFDTLFFALKAVVVVCFFGLVVIIVAQVYTRYMTDQALLWSEEIARFLMFWLVFLAAPIVYREGNHMAVDNLVNILPNVPKKVVLAVSVALQIVFFVVVIVGSLRLFPATSLQRSPANAIVMTNVFAILPISAGLMLLCLLEKGLLMIMPGQKTQEDKGGEQ